MIEQAEILEHHADTAAQARKVGALGGRQIVAEQGDQPARRRLGQIDQLQQRGFAGAGQAGQEGEGAGSSTKVTSRSTSGPAP